MANRCYLYSTNFVPGDAVAEDERRVVGIAEWSWDIPLAFKILLSGSPRKCKSLIWDAPEEITLLGEYDKGVAHLFQFLERVHHPAIDDLGAEAQQFLADPQNKHRFFLLEGSEIFQINSVSEAEENDRLLAEIERLEPQMLQWIAQFQKQVWDDAHPPGFLARLFRKRGGPVRQQDASDLINGLGLGGWSNVLFYEPRS